DFEPQYAGTAWYSSAVPSETASNTPGPGTSSPAANSLTSMRPPDSAVMRSASICAATPGPGRFFGHAVTIFHSTLSWAMAGAATVLAAAPAAAVLRN